MTLPDQNPQTSRQPTGSYSRHNNIYEMKRVMTHLWAKMSVLFGSRWTKENGDIDGLVFHGWMEELKWLGVDAIEGGITSVKYSGSQYAPNLNKFLSHCRVREVDARPGETFSEQLHGGKLKATPEGVPLSWTDQKYTYEELMASPCHEDQIAAENLVDGSENRWL